MSETKQTQQDIVHITWNTRTTDIDVANSITDVMHSSTYILFSIYHIALSSGLLGDHNMWLHHTFYIDDWFGSLKIPRVLLHNMANY